jgi:hypothetical protein
MDVKQDLFKEELSHDEGKGAIATVTSELDAVAVLDVDSLAPHKYPEISTTRSVALVALVMTSSLMQVASGIGGSITIADIGADLR